MTASVPMCLNLLNLFSTIPVQVIQQMSRVCGGNGNIDFRQHYCRPIGYKKNRDIWSMVILIYFQLFCFITKSHTSRHLLVLQKLMSGQVEWINLSKRGRKDEVFQGLAGLLRGNSRGLFWNPRRLSVEVSVWLKI